MKNGILSLAVLVALALFAVPALAAAPLNTVMWGGWGVTIDHPIEGYSSVIGDTVHFAGQAELAADGTWTGQGIFKGTLNGAPIMIRLSIDEGLTYPMVGGGNAASLGGLADVTYRGVTTSDVPFQLGFYPDPSDESFQLRVAGVVWFIEGNDAIKGAVKIS